MIYYESRGAQYVGSKCGYFVAAHAGAKFYRSGHRVKGHTLII